MPNREVEVNFTGLVILVWTRPLYRMTGDHVIPQLLTIKCGTKRTILGNHDFFSW